MFWESETLNICVLVLWGARHHPRNHSRLDIAIVCLEQCDYWSTVVFALRSAARSSRSFTSPFKCTLSMGVGWKSSTIKLWHHVRFQAGAALWYVIVVQHSLIRVLTVLTSLLLQHASTFLSTSWIMSGHRWSEGLCDFCCYRHILRCISFDTSYANGRGRSPFPCFLMGSWWISLHKKYLGNSQTASSNQPLGRWRKPKVISQCTIVYPTQVLTNCVYCWSLSVRNSPSHSAHNPLLKSFLQHLWFIPGHQTDAGSSHSPEG